MQHLSLVLSSTGWRRRGPLRSFAGDNAYSFESCMFYHPLLEELGSPSDRQLFEYSETFVHELTHWLQHHGTSIGGFISLVRHAENRLILHSLQRLPREELKKRLEARSVGTPIFSLLPTHEPDLTDDWPIFGGHLTAKHEYYLVSTTYALFRCYSHLHRHYDPGQMMAHTLLLCEGELRPYRQSQWDDQALSASFEAILKGLSMSFAPAVADVGDDRHIIDTDNLFEAAAMLMEIALILNHYEPDAELQPLPRACTRSLAALGRTHPLSDEYTAALDVAALIFEVPRAVAFDSKTGALEWDFFGTYTPTLIAAIEVALNPRLPPRRSIDHNRIRWYDLYPPQRYLRCLFAAKSIGPLQVDRRTTRVDIIEYMRALADHGGITLALDNELELTDRLIRMDRYVQGSGAATSLEGLSLLDFLLWMQYEVSRMQQQTGEGMMVDLMRSIYQGEAPSSGQPFDFTQSRTRALSPPIVMGSTGLGTTRLWPQELPSWLYHQALHERVINELFVGTATPSLEVERPEFDAEELLKPHRTALAKLLGCDPW